MIWKDSTAPHEPATVPAADGAVVEASGNTTSGTPKSKPALGVGAADPKPPRLVADGPDEGAGVDRPPVGRAAAEGTAVGVAAGCAVGSTARTGAGVSGAGAVPHPQSTAKSEVVAV